MAKTHVDVKEHRSESFQDFHNYIGGKWVETAGGERSKVYDPGTGEVIATVPQAGSKDVDAAVGAARRAFDGGSWSKVNARDRSRLLFRIADALRRERDRLAELEVRQQGKIRAGALWDVEESAFIFEYYAGWATKIMGEVPPVGPDALSVITREPVGVAALITPWNFPILLASQKVAPALAAGCTCVLKPASDTPLTSLELARIAEEVELPPGALNVLTGSGSTVGMELVRHPGVDKISFTGSSEVGKTVMREGASTLKRLTLELGGKNPSIVFADANLDEAIPAICQAIFFNQGEVCGSCSRTFVEESILPEAMDGIAKYVDELKPGYGLDPETTIGPLVSRVHLERVSGYIRAGRDEGAHVAVEGALPKDERLKNGNFVRPTVFAKVSPEMRIAREEIFGPVMSVMSFRDADDAVALANDTNYGLSAMIWTRDIGKALSTAKAVRAGTVWINDTLQAPTEGLWGGFKQSGIGRELGRAGLEGFLELKQLHVKTR
jgi:acyl-CoA reductase-like NAD-dependent aldehyde dehydrogenase